LHRQLPNHPVVTQSPNILSFHTNSYSVVTAKHVVEDAAVRPRHFEKPEMYLWEKIHLVDHAAMFAKNVGLRRRRWFQMYKVDQAGRQHWHPEFKQYDEARHRYVPKGYREPWQRKYGLGRRYSKNAPKVTVPLQDKVSEFQMPDRRFNKKKPLTGYAWKTIKDHGPGFN